MANYRSHRKKKLMAEINVVPYIDVMLVLLVIFMVTAPLLTEGVTVELPEADARTLDAGQSEPFVLTVDREGKLFVESAEKEPSQVTAFAAAVLRRSPKTQFVVRGDKEVSYQHVVDAMVLLQKAGVDTVGLVTDPGGS